MKPASWKFLLTWALAGLLIQCEKEGPQVPIRDDNFLNALIELGIDTDGDGLISTMEAEAVTSLKSLVYKGITDMTGIEAFINLDTLDCAFNLISYLDVSKCTKLKYLSCYSCGLTGLDVSSNRQLRVLHCGGRFELRNQISELDISNNEMLEQFTSAWNPLTSLDLTSNIKLKEIDLFRCQLSSLDLTNNIYLVTLNCDFNQLTGLDMSENSILEILSCSNNQLDNLNVTKNPFLRHLSCSGNQLTSLDVSNNTALELLRCGENQLTTLDISNNHVIGSESFPYNCYLDINNMPTLEEVCVWTLPFPPEGFKLCMEGSPNVYFSTACSK